MERLKFYKETDNRWYVDLPNWTGTKAELEMVAGADTMLDYMAEDTNEVILCVSEEPFEGSDELVFLNNADDIGEGAYYKLSIYKGIDINLEMWLCNVTSWVFGKFPKSIFITSINN